MDWTGINENLKKAIDMQNKSQQAKMNFQTKLMMSKIDAIQEQKIKEMQPDYQLKELALRQYKEQMGSGQGGQFDISSGGDIKRLGLKDMAERVYTKPQEQWTPQDKAIVNQYHAMLQDTPQPVIDPETGKMVYTRPKGSVFQPKGSDEDVGWMGGGGNQPQAQPTEQPSGRIRVKNKAGQTGTIEIGEFDPNEFEKI